jgi:hypothetical protein
VQPFGRGASLLSDRDASRGEHLLAVLHEVRRARLTAEEELFAVHLAAGAPLLHLEDHPAHGAVGALPDLRARLLDNVGRPADSAKASATFAAVEALIDCLPNGRCGAWLRSGALLLCAASHGEGGYKDDGAKRRIHTALPCSRTIHINCMRGHDDCARTYSRPVDSFELKSLDTKAHCEVVTK